MKLTKQNGSEAKLGSGDKVVFYTERNTLRFITKDGEELRIDESDNQLFLDAMTLENRTFFMADLMNVISMILGKSYRLASEKPGLKCFELL
jgi:hypothetical protein